MLYIFTLPAMFTFRLQSAHHGSKYRNLIPFYRLFSFAFILASMMLFAYAAVPNASAAADIVRSSSRQFFDAPKAGSLKQAPQDIQDVINNNEQIFSAASELKALVEEKGESARNSEEFLLKMKSFLLLVTDNKIEYIEVLKMRIEKSHVFSSEERANLLSLLEADLSYFVQLQEEVSAVSDWESAREIGNQIQAYTAKTAERLRGFAGIRMLDEAQILIARAERIHASLKENIDTILSANPSSFDNAQTKSGEVFDLNSTLSNIESSIAKAKEYVNAAKNVYMSLIELQEAAVQDAVSNLRNAHQELRNARKYSLSVTIQLIQVHLKSSKKQ